MHQLYTIKTHPAADIFPMVTDAELVQIADDIAENGLVERISVIAADDGTEELLDGRTRREAIRRIPDTARREELEEQAWHGRQVFLREDCDPYALVKSLNLHRRHLTAAQKRRVTAELVKANPERSDRVIAKLARVSDKTVGVVRAELEGRAEIPHVVTRTDSKGRKQPASKPTAVTPTPAETVTPTPAEPLSGRSPLDRENVIEDVTWLLRREPAETLDALEQILQGAHGHIIGLPYQKRIAWAHGYVSALAIGTPGQTIINDACLRALGIGLSDLQPIIRDGVVITLGK